MANQTTVLQCPVCAQRLRVPCDLGEIQVTCPACRARWPWKAKSSRRAVLVLNVVAGVLLIAALAAAFVYLRQHAADEKASATGAKATSASAGDSAGAPERPMGDRADGSPDGSAAEGPRSADSLTASKILTRSGLVYGNCKTYQDQGKLTLHIGSSDIVFQFSTTYAKPDHFRYERKYVETTRGTSNIPLPSAGGGPVSSGGDKASLWSASQRKLVIWKEKSIVDFWVDDPKLIPDREGLGSLSLGKHLAALARSLALTGEGPGPVARVSADVPGIFDLLLADEQSGQNVATAEQLLIPTEEAGGFRKGPLHAIEVPKEFALESGMLRTSDGCIDISGVRSGVIDSKNRSHTYDLYSSVRIDEKSLLLRRIARLKVPRIESGALRALEDTPVWVEVEFKNVILDAEIPKQALELDPPK